MKYLNQAEAINIDLELFNLCKFSVDQLMELAGLSCAHVISKVYKTNKKVLVICGPGNNGGDGLVCARHLSMMNFIPEILYPKQTENELYKNLKHQCEIMGITILKHCPELKSLNNEYGVIIDAVFGFSFKPPIRETFIEIIELMKNTIVPIASIDIPSGWHVEKGPGDNDIQPETLISLTAPKMCAQYFKGKNHYLGGRFVPNVLQEKYQLNLPNYTGVDMCIRL